MAGQQCLFLKRLYSFENNDEVNVSSMEINLHTGTHIDLPQHFIRDGESASAVDLVKFCGKAKVICLDVNRNIEGKDLER
ncbi:MAG: cyclase family protein [Bacteroidota bacterium]